MVAFKYIIDIDNANDFAAHVEDDNHCEIFEITGYEHLNDLNAYVKSKIDVGGLRQYLVDHYIICDNDILFTAHNSPNTLLA